MNVRRMMNKLVLAINLRGRRVKINQVQKYSERCGRMVTKYMVYEYRPDEKPKNVTLLETYQIADVVKLLAGIYSDGG